MGIAQTNVLFYLFVFIVVACLHVFLFPNLAQGNICINQRSYNENCKDEGGNTSLEELVSYSEN